MTYDEAVEYLLSIPKFTKKNEPSHTREFLHYLGDPQEQFQVIHVAGSNGKGSVCAFLNGILLEGKKTVGLFTSPHLVDIRERFCVNGKMCSKEMFLEAFRTVSKAVERMRQDGLAHPTFFEFLFAMGMVIFEQAGVAYVILETGLGGRLDATNTVQHPILTVITSISLEHTEILGDTIARIAAEKAGIIKDRVPVIFDGDEKEAAEVIRACAAAHHAPVREVVSDSINIFLNDGKSIDFSLKSEYDESRVRIATGAVYQTMNAALALTAARELDLDGIGEKVILDGIRYTLWPGRMEQIAPEIYVDGAHNVAGIGAFLESVKALTGEPSVLLFSMVKEKDYMQAVRFLCRDQIWHKVILTKIPDNPRALSVEELAAAFEAAGYKREELLLTEDLDRAMEEAQSSKHAGQLLFCTGSLYLVGAIKKMTGGECND